MNNFGGQWTKAKMEIFMKYLPAYLTIMNSVIEKQAYAKNWKLIYFDGFAGSGAIIENEYDSESFIEGVSTRVLSIEKPREFDLYRFVDLDENNVNSLQNLIDANFSNKKAKIKIYNDDFNEVVKKLAAFMQKYKNYKCLAFVDPYGMSVNWSSLETLKGLSIDMWILVPTGLGANRLLKKDGNISDAWYEKLENFLGINRADIDKEFYKTIPTLFGEEKSKESDSISKIHKIYKSRLNTIFKYVSDAYVMKNTQNSIMYHFLLASNNQTAINIANHIVGTDISKI